MYTCIVYVDFFFVHDLKRWRGQCCVAKRIFWFYIHLCNVDGLAGGQAGGQAGGLAGWLVGRLPFANMPSRHARSAFSIFRRPIRSPLVLRCTFITVAAFEYYGAL